MTKGWTEERRRAQAERCRANRPWENATGPRTDAGKARAAMNAYKHGRYSAVFPELRAVLYHNAQFLKHFKQYSALKFRGDLLKNELIKRRQNQPPAPPPIPRRADELKDARQDSRESRPRARPSRAEAGGVEKRG